MRIAETRPVLSAGIVPMGLYPRGDRFSDCRDLARAVESLTMSFQPAWKVRGGTGSEHGIVCPPSGNRGAGAGAYPSRGLTKWHCSTYLLDVCRMFPLAHFKGQPPCSSMKGLMARFTPRGEPT